MNYQAVIGLEVHAELQTKTKMFCGCPVVDSTKAAPNTAVCSVCSGLPGALPVVNKKAVEYAIRVALALGCKIAHTSIFARKNYFYPDLPKGYQISQYENPLAQFGVLSIDTPLGTKDIHITRIHMEEDAGKLTHVVDEKNGSYSLVDLNRAGVALLEIVSEPDLNSAEEAVAYAVALRDIVRELGVNSGDMEKGVIRFEANVSLRLPGAEKLGTRVEIKNLNTFRGMEKAIRYEIARQTRLLDMGQSVIQETLGWNEDQEVTYSHRSKEEAHDYRYFPEPDLPPLVVEEDWIEEIKSKLPELPRARLQRIQRNYGLNLEDARLIASDEDTTRYFEEAVRVDPEITPKTITNWIAGQILSWINSHSKSIRDIPVQPQELVNLLQTLQKEEINQNTAKIILEEMLISGKPANQIIAEKGYQQVSDATTINGLVAQVLQENPKPMADYLAGKETLIHWFFGQVMRAAQGQANPQVLREELEKQLRAKKRD
ncbi:MAG: Asp-tRNA(Asn)/Glu-tRNA(Gln) amidotransferase GatCAB subunit B [Chloroflexi bacterium HGW-Chloroflexi-8]|nr:MAG: Asp-tRNA(Asn)/Glu-tRNA(Gln) amidotransferase GatCAB subunit B [Chloroflexi bacterium HGW-Chloroflexi-8]